MADVDCSITIRAYAEQLLEDEDARVQSVMTASRGAYSRARSKKRKRDTTTDGGLQRRLRGAAVAASEGTEMLGEAPPTAAEAVPAGDAARRGSVTERERLSRCADANSSSNPYPTSRRSTEEGRK